MQIAGIVAEYNPFHYGHKYQIEAVKSLGYSHIAVIMSGDFVQRGELAVCDKWQRARAALQNGADIVAEIPVSYSLASAETFAKASTKLLELIGVDSIAFGCECDDMQKLNKLASFTSTISKSDELKDLTNKGTSFPSALQAIVNEKFGSEYSNILSDANNVLALEYIKNMDKRVTPIPILRAGISHDSDETIGNFASASKIREIIRSGGNTSQFTPGKFNNFSDFSKIESAVFLKLRSLKEENFLSVPDMTEELADRFIKAAKTTTNLQDFLNTVKTKRYTMARIKRIVLSIFIGITKADSNFDFSYIRILGMNKKGKEILSSAKNIDIPINTSLSSLAKQNENAKRAAVLESYASDIFSFTTEKPLPSGSDFTTFPIII